MMARSVGEVAGGDGLGAFGAVFSIAVQMYLWCTGSAAVTGILRISTQAYRPGWSDNQLVIFADGLGLQICWMAAQSREALLCNQQP